MYIRVKPIVESHLMRSLCCHQYYNHPLGCPNYDKKPGCPPKAKIFDKVYDMSQPIYAIYNTFDLASHIAKMREKHPRWSDRQLKCCLYWQGTARKRLKEQIRLFRLGHSEFSVCKTPEAMGVNLTQTMINVGIELEWPPVNKTYQIVLASKRL